MAGTDRRKVAGEGRGKADTWRRSEDVSKRHAQSTINGAASLLIDVNRR